MNAINRILNVALIIAALLLTVSLIRSYDPTLLGTKDKGIVGNKVSLDGIDFSKSQKTMLLFIQQDCSPCETSIPFYQRLGNTFVEPARVRLIAVMPGRSANAQTYLLEKGVRIDDIKQWKAGLFGIKHSPTIVLADDKGVVTGAWVGLLSDDQQSNVLSRLRE